MKKQFIILILIFAGALSGFSQTGQTMYNMPAIPQVTYSNPAFRPEAKGFFGMPGISFVGIDIGHTGFAMNDVIKQMDTSFTIDVDNTLQKLGNTNFLYFEETYEPIAFGFRIAKEKGYLTFHIAQKSYMQFVYPKSLIQFPVLGNGDPEYLGKTADFSDLGVNASAYAEVAIGYQHSILENLSVGGRVKMLGGVFNVYTDNKALSLTTNEEDFALTANADVTVNYSSPVELFDDSLAEEQNFSPSDIPGYIKKNMGVAFDFGVTYEFQETFLFSASVIDLGYINWKAKPNNYATKGSFTFTGFNLNDMIIDTLEFDDIVDNMLDSIEDIFDIQESNNAYKQMLNPKIYIGAGMHISKNTFAGLLLRSEMYRGKYFPSATLSVNQRFGRWLSLSASYSAYRNSYFNIGGGFALKLGPYQLYLIADNIYGAFKPDFARNLNFQFGMNWLIGHKPDKNEASLDAE
ncbi:MAG: DUF5723 family protein [Bacteroidales bacterium]|nr:DUF5723 family protein [Bacteroidales bacterium]